MSDAPLEPDYRRILLSLIGSITLADHLGDVASYAEVALKQAGIKLEWGDLDELSTALGRMGVMTLYGTELKSDDEEAD